mgnify:CR=1 FL=1|jgi:archaellum component FlaC
MKNVSDTLDDIMVMGKEIDDKVSSLSDLIETMMLTNQDMFNKIQFLEKRINLIEDEDVVVGWEPK